MDIKLIIRNPFTIQIIFISTGILALTYFGFPLVFDGLYFYTAVILGVLFGFAIFCIVVLISRTRTGLGQSFRENVERNKVSLGKLSTPSIVSIALAAGICEEVLFRGAVFGIINEYYGAILALTISSVVFGILHFGSISYFIFTTIYGVALGLAYYFTESIVLVAVWHFVYDLLALLFISKFPEVFHVRSATT